MGWWQFDPETGSPVVGVKGDQGEPHYAGDGPWDVVNDYSDQIADLLGDATPPSEDDARRLIIDRAVPSGLPTKVGRRVVELVDEFWTEIDACYEDDWERPALAGEKTWCGERFAERIC